MAITVINLSDPVSSWVSKTNTIASNLGDVTLITIGGSDIVTAINRLDSNIGTLSTLTTDDKSDIVSALNETYALAIRGNEYLNDSDEIKALFLTNDSNGIHYSADSGLFSIADSSITSDMFNQRTTLLIKNSSGTIVKTLFSPGN